MANEQNPTLDKAAGITKNLSEFTDKELADMVRGSLYARGTRFGDGDRDSRFLLVLAVPYGNDEHVDTLEDAIGAFARLLQDDDWKEREFQIYDHAAPQHFFAASMEEVEAEIESGIRPGTLCVYELNEENEAESVRWFCSEECRGKWPKEHNFNYGTNDDWIEGTVCDECGAELAAGGKS